MRRLTLCIAFMLLAAAAAFAQRDPNAGRAIRDYYQERRSTVAGQDAAEAEHAAEHAAMWAKVNDGDAFVALCARLRRDEVARLYSAQSVTKGRNKGAQQTSWGLLRPAPYFATQRPAATGCRCTRARRDKRNPKTAERIAHFNDLISSVNDPTRPWVPEPARPDIPDAALIAAKRRAHFDEIEDRLKRRGDVRNWTTKRGRTAAVALVLYDLGKVTIKAMDGNETVLTLVDLSPADWDYVVENAPAPKRRH